MLRLSRRVHVSFEFYDLFDTHVVGTGPGLRTREAEEGVNVRWERDGKIQRGSDLRLTLKEETTLRLIRCDKNLPIRTDRVPLVIK